MTFAKVGSGSEKCKQNNFVFTVTSINDSFVLFVFLSRDVVFPKAYAERGRKKKGGKEGPCPAVCML